jgi:hypothetical protein
MTSLADNPAFASSTAGSSEAAAANRDLLRVGHSSDKPRCDAERMLRSR